MNHGIIKTAPPPHKIEPWPKTEKRGKKRKERKERKKEMNVQIKTPPLPADTDRSNIVPRPVENVIAMTPRSLPLERFGKPESRGDIPLVHPNLTVFFLANNELADL